MCAPFLFLFLSMPLPEQSDGCMRSKWLPEEAVDGRFMLIGVGEVLDCLGHRGGLMVLADDTGVWRRPGRCSGKEGRFLACAWSPSLELLGVVLGQTISAVPIKLWLECLDCVLILRRNEMVACEAWDEVDMCEGNVLVWLWVRGGMW